MISASTLVQIHYNDLTQQWVPHLLRTSMANLTANKLKQTGIGQSIVQASRPQSHQFYLMLVFHWIQNLDVD